VDYHLVVHRGTLGNILARSLDVIAPRVFGVEGDVRAASALGVSVQGEETGDFDFRGPVHKAAVVRDTWRLFWTESAQSETYRGQVSFDLKLERGLAKALLRWIERWWRDGSPKPQSAGQSCSAGRSAIGCLRRISRPARDATGVEAIRSVRHRNGVSACNRTF
jgi:hypothetical protein